MKRSEGEMDLGTKGRGTGRRNGKLSQVCGLSPGPMHVVLSPIKHIIPVILVQHLPPHRPVSSMSCSILNPRANQNTWYLLGNR